MICVHWLLAFNFVNTYITSQESKTENRLGMSLGKLFSFLLLISLFIETGSLYNSYCPVIHYIDPVVLGLKATVPNLFCS